MIKTYNLTKTNEYADSLKKILPSGMHSNFRLKDRKMPLYFSKGKKSRLWDLDGNEYLDLFAKAGVMILGHDNKTYSSALKRQIDRLLMVDSTEIDIEACMLLKEFIPCCEMVRFGLSGTEMVQNAIRLSRAYTRKNKILRFIGHYHGSADNVMGGEVEHDKAPVPTDRGKNVFSTEGRAEGVLETQNILIPWNDIKKLDETIRQYRNEIAAVITEPISLNGGSIMPKEGFLEKLRDLCSKNSIVLIFDEIITGIRTGLGGAQALFNVVPDLCVLGKSIGGGVPVTVLVGKKELLELYGNNKVIHGGTFNGYPLGIAAMIATFKILRDDEKKYYENMSYFSKKIHNVLLENARNIGMDMVVQGPPSCASFHCTEKEVDSISQITDDILMKNGIIRECMAAYGILIYPTSRMYTNISIEEDDINFFENRIGYALNDAKVLFARLQKKSDY